METNPKLYAAVHKLYVPSIQLDETQNVPNKEEDKGTGEKVSEDRGLTSVFQ